LLISPQQALLGARPAPEEEFSVAARAFASLDEVPRPPGGYRAAYLIMKANQVVEAARKANVAVPLNAALVRLIEEIKAGRRPIGPENLTDLLAAVPEGA